MRHWGHDITDEDTPLEAGLGFTIAWDKPVDFNGRSALEKQREQPRTKRLIQLRIEDPDLLTYHDEPLYRDGAMVGRATAGAFGHVLGQSLALGYVAREAGALGTALQIEILGTRRAATVIADSAFDPINQRPRA